MMVLLTFIAFSPQAQTTVTIGTGTSTSYYSPVYISTTSSSFRYSQSISLFTPAEINMAGNLISLAWEKSDAVGYTAGDATFRIYVKETTATSVATASGTFATELAGATLVYESFTASLPAAPGWVSFNLTTPFAYSGTSNLMVMVDWDRPSAPTANYPNFYYTNSPGMAATWGASSTPPTTSYGSGYTRANIQMTFAPSAALDAGIAAINAPQTPFLPGNNNVEATIRNYGTSNLTSATIHWMVNGVAQTPYNWTGNLASAAIDSAVVIGTFNFPLGTHEITAWTANPNGGVDSSTFNDTASVSVICIVPLNGTYTIGGSSPDYATFADALSALSAGGISGPVTFNVASGTYNERVSLPEVLGADANNRITFQSATGNAADVIIQSPVSGTSDNWVWKFDGADYITVQNLTIKIDTPYVSYGRVVVFDNGSNYNILTGNVIESIAATGSSTNYTTVYSENSQDEFNIISHNTILNGTYGIRMYSPNSTTLEMGNIIESNTIDGYAYYGIYMYGQDAPIVTKNTLTNAANAGIVYGIYMYYCDNMMQVTKNRLELSGSSTQYGIKLYYSDAAMGMEGLVANNFIAQTSSASVTTYAIHLNYVTYQQIYYNSVNVASTGATTYGLYVTTGATDIDFTNNIVAMPGGGRVAYATTTTIAGITAMDHNAYFTTGANLAYGGTNLTTLADWQTFSLMDLNSVVADPGYASPALLYPTSAGVDNLAIPIAMVPDDIDGNIRSMTTPDPGAAEFDPPTNDMAVLSWDMPLGSSCGLSSTESITISLYNNGLSAQTGTEVSYSIDGGTTWSNPEIIGNPIPAGDTLVYTFTTLADLSAIGVYNTMAAVNAPGDANSLNDSISGISVTNIGLISLPFMEDFSAGNTAYFGLESEPEALIEVNSLQGNAVPALFFTGGAATGFSGSASSTSPTQAWVDNTTHHASAKTCQIDGSGLNSLKLTFDLKMEYSYGWGYSWFRVLVNDTIQLTDLNGTSDFHPTTASSDPFATVEFDLTPYLAQPFTITLQSSMKYAVGTGSANGDNAYVDNIQIYEPLPNDVGINAILHPVDSACASANTDVVVDLRNFGGVVQDSVPVVVEVTFPDATTQTLSAVYTDSLQANGSDMFTVGNFPTLMTGTYHLTAYTNLPGDINNMNDTAWNSFISVQPINTFPVTENFESFTTGAPGTFANGWVAEPTTGFRWQVNSGTTTSSFTGPEVDHTTGTATGIYVYTEASSGSSGDVATLTSPCLDFSTMTAPELRFWYHMYGADIDKLAVDVMDGGVWTEVFSIIGTQQTANTDPWLEAVVSLVNYPNADKIRFRVPKGADYEGDVSIDDVTLQEAPQFEAALLEAYGLSSGCNLTTDQLTIKIHNRGGQTINGNLSASYMIHGAAAAVTETVTDSIAVGDTLEFTFTAPINLLTAIDSMFAVTTWIDLLNDPDPSNDTAMTSVNSLVSPMDPMVANVTINAGSQATLSVINPDPNQVYAWYDSLMAAQEISVGDTFLTPALTANTVYWVEAQYVSFSDQATFGLASSTNSYIPAYGLYDYSWSKSLYTADELGFEGQIDTLSFFVSNSLSTPYLMPNQRIWMAHTSDSAFADLMYLDTTLMTKVYDGSIEWTGPGEIKIALAQPFTYDGDNNIIIYYENWDGVWASGYPTFVSSPAGPNQAVYEYDDGTFPYVAGSSSTTKPDLGFYGSFILGGNGCPSNRVADTVFVTAPSVVAMASNDTTICLGDSAQLNVNVTGGQAPYTYAWSPAASLNNATIANPAAGPVVTTTYSVTVTDQNGDSGTDDVIVTVDPGPNVTLSPFANVCLNSSAFTLTGGSPAGGVYSGPGVSGGMFDPAIADTGIHTITYTYTDPVSGCSGYAMENIYVDPCVGLNALDSDAKLSIFPNPASEMVQISFTINGSEARLMLMDLTGKQIWERNILNSGSQMSETLDISKLPQGIYYVRLQDGAHIKAVKLIKH